MSWKWSALGALISVDKWNGGKAPNFSLRMVENWQYGKWQNKWEYQLVLVIKSYPRISESRDSCPEAFLLSCSPISKQKMKKAEILSVLNFFLYRTSLDTFWSHLIFICFIFIHLFYTYFPPVYFNFFLKLQNLKSWYLITYTYRPSKNGHNLNRNLKTKKST